MTAAAMPAVDVRRDRVRAHTHRQKLDLLYREHEGTIRTCVAGAQRTYARDLDPHEIQAEAHLAFLRVAKAWRPDGGAKFSTLLNLAINNGVKTRAKSNRRHRRASDMDTQKPHTVEPLTDLMVATIPDTERSGVAEETERAISAIHRTELRDECKVILAGLLEGKKPSIVARELQMSRVRLGRILEEEIVPTLFRCSTATLYERARQRRLVV